MTHTHSEEPPFPVSPILNIGGFTRYSWWEREERERGGERDRGRERQGERERERERRRETNFKHFYE